MNIIMRGIPLNEKKLLACLLSVAMIATVLPVNAVEIQDESVTVVDTIETDAEDVSSEDETLNSEDSEYAEVSEDAQITETSDDTDEVAEEATTTEDVDTTEEATEEELTSVEENKIEDIDDRFALTAEEKAAKAGLAVTLASLDNCKEGVDYNVGEIYFITDEKEEALAVADCYGGTLSDYEYGVAVVSLPEDISVKEAVAFSASEDSNMLPVSPNFVVKSFEEFTDNEYTENTETEVIDDVDYSDMLEVTEYIEDNEEEELELEYNVDRDFTDPYLHTQSNKFQYQHSIVGSEYAWKAGYTGSGITVAVIDTGVNEMSGELPVAARSHFIGSSDNDGAGHGTHVAGIIAARVNGSYGAGIAPDATIKSYKVLGDDGSGATSYSVAAVRAAVKDGVDIINLSLGSIAEDPNFQIALNEAYNAGVIVVAAAGNDGGLIDSYPACYDNVISVGATNEINKRSDYSNVNKKIDVCAPGSRIWSTNRTGGDYVDKSGTSMACPVVSGIIAVLLSSGKLGTKSPARVDATLNLMKKNSIFVHGMLGSGIPYLPSMLDITTEGLKPAAPTISYTISADFKEINVTISGQQFSKIIYTTDGKTPANKTGLVGNWYNGKFSIPVSKNKYTIKAIAVNESGVASKIAVSTVNVKPTVASISISGVNQVARGKSVALTATVLPAIATNKTLRWSVSGGYGVTVTQGGRVNVAKDASTGTYTVRADATDGSKKYGTYTITVLASEVVDSVSFTNKNITMERGSTATTQSVASYLVAKKKGGGDVDKKTYIVWSTNKPAVASVDSTGKVTANGPGSAIITATANDGSGKKATVNIKVVQKATSVTISGGSTKIAAGKKATFKVTVGPDNTTNKKVKWTVSGGSGVTVSPAGVVSVAKDAYPTTYTVKATADDGSGVSGSKNFTVVSGAITKLTMEKKSDTIFRVKDTQNPNVTEPTSTVLRVYVEGEANCDKSMLTATSSNTSVATVGSVTSDGGNYYKVTVSATGNQTGTTAITISSVDGSAKNVKCNVRVINPASSLTIAAGNADFAEQIVEGKTMRLVANLGTQYGTPSTKKVDWEIISGESPYVNISAGVLKIKKGYKGTASITVKATVKDGSGLSNTFTVGVVPESLAFHKMFIANRTNWSWADPRDVEIPKVYYLKADPGYLYGIGWVFDIRSNGWYYRAYNGKDLVCHFACSSGNNAVATVQMEGNRVLICPKKPGATTITIMDHVSGKSMKQKIVVR